MEHFRKNHEINIDNIRHTIVRDNDIRFAEFELGGEEKNMPLPAKPEVTGKTGELVVDAWEDGQAGEVGSRRQSGGTNLLDHSTDSGNAEQLGKTAEFAQAWNFENPGNSENLGTPGHSEQSAQAAEPQQAGNSGEIEQSDYTEYTEHVKPSPAELSLADLNFWDEIEKVQPTEPTEPAVSESVSNSKLASDSLGDSESRSMAYEFNSDGSSYDGVRYYSREQQFVLKARELAWHVEPEHPFVPFKSYWPTYEQMTLPQYKWYFYWREEVRSGRYPETDLSYLFVYMYELINGIGWSNPVQGYQLLSNVWDAYRDRYPKLDVYAREWLYDFSLVHGLDMPVTEIYDRIPRSLSSELRELEWLRRFSEEPLVLNWDLLSDLIDYEPEKSRFYQEGGRKDMRTYGPQVIALVDAYLGKTKGHRLLERFRPREKTWVRYVFRSAVYDYDIYGRTVSVMILPISSHAPLRDYITQLIRLMENKLRELRGFKGRLRGIEIEPEIEELVVRFLKREIEPASGTKEKEDKPEVRIDHTKLRQLQQDSDDVRNMLLMDEAEKALGAARIEPQQTTLEQAAQELEKQEQSKQAAGSLEQDKCEQGVFRQSLLEQDALEREPVEQSTLEQSTLEQESLEPVEKSALEQGSLELLEDDIVNREKIEQGTYQKEALQKMETPKQNTLLQMDIFDIEQASGDNEENRTSKMPLAAVDQELKQQTDQKPELRPERQSEPQPEQQSEQQLTMELEQDSRDGETLSLVQDGPNENDDMQGGSTDADIPASATAPIQASSTGADASSRSELIWHTDELDEEWQELSSRLESVHLEVLYALKYGPNMAAVRAAAEAAGSMPALLIDEINDAAMEIIGDLLIDGEDLVDEYRAMFDQLMR